MKQSLWLKNYQIIEVLASENGHGLCIGVRIDMDVQVQVITKTENILIVKLYNEKSELCIGTIYRHNQGVNRRKTLQKLQGMIEKLNIPTIIAGDWNSTEEEIKYNLEGTLFITIAGDNTKGTRINRRLEHTERIIDFVLTNNVANVLSVKNKVNHISDHMTVETGIKWSHKIKSQGWTKFNRKKLGDINRREIINHVSYRQEDTLESAIQKITFEYKLIQQPSSIKIHEIKADKELVKLLKEAKQARNITEKDPSEENIQGIKDTRIKVREKLRELKVEASERKYVQLNEKMVQNDTRAMWQAIKWQIKLSRKGAPLKGIKSKDGEMADSKEVAINIWKEHFEALSRKEESCTMEGIVKKENKKITQITDAYIKWEEVQAALKKLKRNKAESADKIPQEFYKLVEKEKVPTSELAKALCTTLRDVSETGIILESWKIQ